MERKIFIMILLMVAGLNSSERISRIIQNLPRLSPYFHNIKIDKKGDVHLIYIEEKKEKEVVAEIFYKRISFTNGFNFVVRNIDIKASPFKYTLKAKILDHSGNKLVLLIEKNHTLYPEKQLLLVIVEADKIIKRKIQASFLQGIRTKRGGNLYIFYDDKENIFFGRWLKGNIITRREIPKDRGKFRVNDSDLNMISLSDSEFIICSLVRQSRLIKKVPVSPKWKKAIWEHKYAIQYFALDTLGNFIVEPTQISWESAKEKAFYKFSLPESIRVKIGRCYLSPSRDGGVWGLFTARFMEPNCIILKFDSNGNLIKGNPKKVKAKKVDGDFWWDVFLKQEGVKPPEIKITPKREVFLYGIDLDGNFYYTLERIE